MKYHVFEFLRDYKPQENNIQLERYAGKDIESYVKGTTEKAVLKKLNLKIIRRAK